MTYSQCKGSVKLKEGKGRTAELGEAERVPPLPPRLRTQGSQSRAKACRG